MEKTKLKKHIAAGDTYQIPNKRHTPKKTIVIMIVIIMIKE